MMKRRQLLPILAVILATTAINESFAGSIVVRRIPQLLQRGGFNVSPKPGQIMQTISGGRSCPTGFTRINRRLFSTGDSKRTYADSAEQQAVFGTYMPVAVGSAAIFAGARLNKIKHDQDLIHADEYKKNYHKDREIRDYLIETLIVATPEKIESAINFFNESDLRRKKLADIFLAELDLALTDNNLVTLVKGTLGNDHSFITTAYDIALTLPKESRLKTLESLLITFPLDPHAKSNITAQLKEIEDVERLIEKITVVAESGNFQGPGTSGAEQFKNETLISSVEKSPLLYDLPYMLHKPSYSTLVRIQNPAIIRLLEDYSKKVNLLYEKDKTRMHEDTAFKIAQNHMNRLFDFTLDYMLSECRGFRLDQSGNPVTKEFIATVFDSENQLRRPFIKTYFSDPFTRSYKSTRYKWLQKIFAKPLELDSTLFVVLTDAIREAAKSNKSKTQSGAFFKRMRTVVPKDSYQDAIGRYLTLRLKDGSSEELADIARELASDTKGMGVSTYTVETFLQAAIQKDPSTLTTLGIAYNQNPKFKAFIDRQGDIYSSRLDQYFTSEIAKDIAQKANNINRNQK